MVNHIYILYMIITFCTGMVFYVPSLVWFLRRKDTFKYYTNYKYFFHSFTAFTVLIFSNSIYYYIIYNIPDAGIYVLIFLIVTELISIHMFLLFLPVFIHNFFSVKLTKVLNIIFISLSIISLTTFLILFFKHYIGDIDGNIKEKIISFPVAAIYNTIFAIIVLYFLIISILYLKKLNDDLLQRMVVSYFVLILFIFFGVFILLLFQSEINFLNSINIKIYILPGCYLLWSIFASYFNVKYFLFDTNVYASQNFSLEKFLKEYDLTDRETEIVKLLLNGCGNTEICDELSISLPTVKSHISNIFKKACCSSRSELLSIIIHGV
jgi:DNA-binding CsgD family transcriptional regulator